MPENFFTKNQAGQSQAVPMVSVGLFAQQETYTDDVDSDLQYTCTAIPGVGLSEEKWQVFRYNTATNQIRFANGSNQPEFAATDLATVKAYDYEIQP